MRSLTNFLKQKMNFMENYRYSDFQVKPIRQNLVLHLQRHIWITDLPFIKSTEVAESSVYVNYLLFPPNFVGELDDWTNVCPQFESQTLFIHSAVHYFSPKNWWICSENSPALNSVSLANSRQYWQGYRNTMMLKYLPVIVTSKTA